MAISSLLSIVSASHLPFSSPSHQLRRRAHPPISISTTPSDVDVLRLRDLLVSAGHSCHRFPASAGEGPVEPADIGKLQTAIYHSFIVVSVFCRSRFLPSSGAVVEERQWPDETSVALGFEHFFESKLWAPGSDHHLIGFGRAVSDRGLTASIHDVVFHTIMKIRSINGYGREFDFKEKRISRALCSEKERLFFEACGFGKDPLDSTTMMYTRTPSSDEKGNFMVRAAGQMQLVVPHPLKLYPSEKKHW